MARFQKPGNVSVDECVFPECAGPPSEMFELPMCDQHIMSVYRSVVAYGATQPKQSALCPRCRRSKTSEAADSA